MQTGVTGPPPINIRRAAANDLELLIEMGRRTFYETFRDDCSVEDMRLFLDTSYARDKVAGELSQDASHFLIAEDENGAIGYSRIFEETPAPEFIPGGRSVELVRFYLERRSIGQGVAQSLMNETLTLCRDLDYAHVYLGVWEKNFRAQRFYEKYGFRRIDTGGEKIFLVGNDPQIDWYYLLSL